MFRTYENQLVVKDIIPTDEEVRLFNLTDLPYERVATPKHATALVNDKDFQALQKEVDNVRQDLNSFEATFSDKSPSLDDVEIPLMNESQLAALEAEFHDLVTPMKEAQNRKPEKYDSHLGILVLVQLVAVLL
ncbi:hypothetical protein HAX54_029109 [Datura stramonium]|uniref:Uncharacterized protein n=1 Tax=Datura stramonium TaxID=4076 RepID=A0ABS8RLC9_DATST|nr:hypothetical protein [Datura stramonium]